VKNQTAVKKLQVRKAANLTVRTGIKAGDTGVANLATPRRDNIAS
jgi:hypothetical protein